MKVAKGNLKVESLTRDNIQLHINNYFPYIAGLSML